MRMRACSQVCGVVFNPIDEDYVNVCDECEHVGKHEIETEHERVEGTSYYLGKCGLIIDYLL
jgi:ribosome-binding protein aMBF1 (putative translation factor)